ncbi:Bifunctional protein: zinc-containing alcohol dehydrogenase; quinone oxidoreductase (NADPH:quinone reductase); Similar to arginate lyase [Alloalcanivorax xenomutans]|uniref:alcohol dehydrogenase catalytic domain-containing protein n=1 Tax=Alloalcanivorax xenomutans TaxID=1094342 RepID=UPI0006D5BDD4|nr:alcohol dehydrogenase catalytic domain-containing protein [Alloalcanivorax xenomutans]PHS60720.1 MAG: DNA-binding protein [Alcanivorax sp.]CUR47463.1 Bifunctional protein: zinc-containing alcohol dehydrogenase; quinone oxidoreductase (NADPH:quinone reductase); Similar to arginate lyase [Alloalcanivorax xenomutans]
MKAFIIGDSHSGTLRPTEVPAPPAPANNQVQLELIGTSINPIDPLVAKGYGAPLLNTKRQVPLIPGRDAVARVVDVGKGVTDVQPGQRVLVAASPRTGGTYAAIFNLPRKCVAPIEESLSDATAAGLGYAGLTALQALAEAGLSADNARGKTLCINGASGGVGSIALVLARRWGAQITAVASERNQEWVRRLGADQTVNYRDPAAMAAIEADIILNFAAPGDNHRQDPLLDLLRRRDTAGRAYLNTTNPVLSSVTDKGVVGGLATSGGIYARKRLAARRAGIHYRWVLFKEDAERLAYLAEVFADPDTPTIVSDSRPLEALPEAFNDPKGVPSPGKGVFLANAT